MADPKPSTPSSSGTLQQERARTEADKRNDNPNQDNDNNTPEVADPTKPPVVEAEFTDKELKLIDEIAAKFLRSPEPWFFGEYIRHEEGVRRTAIALVEWGKANGIKFATFNVENPTASQADADGDDETEEALIKLGHTEEAAKQLGGHSTNRPVNRDNADTPRLDR
jgi:hypothetical protein